MPSEYETSEPAAEPLPGPTRTITVSAQLHLARFTDMAANFAPTEKFVKDN